MRKKILLFHEIDRFSKLLLNYVKENYFETVDIYLTEDKEIIKNMNFDIFLIEERHEYEFKNVLVTKKYILSENWFYKENNCKNRIYKYTPVKHIMNSILEKERLQEKFSILSLASFSGGVGKTEILNAVFSEYLTSKNKVVIVSFDFFEKFKGVSNCFHLDQLIYYIYKGRDVPEKFIDEMRQAIYKYGVIKYIFSGNPGDFERIGESHIDEFILYFQKYIKPDFLIIEWPNLSLQNSRKILELSDKIFFICDYSHKDNFDKFTEYYFSEYTYSKAKTIFLMNKSIVEKESENIFYIPFFKKEIRSGEMRRCMRGILENQLMI